MQFSQRTQRFAGTGSTAWDVHYQATADKSAGRDVVVMSVGDYEVATPKPIVDSAVQALRDGDTHYTNVVGITALREAVARDHQRRTGATTDASNVLITAGTQNALYFAVQCLLSSGDEALVLEPMYVTYEATIGSSEATLVPIPCPAEQGFKPSIAAIKAAITPRTRGLFLATPANPTGAVLTREELTEIADVCREHDLWVVSDEVYGDLVFDGEMVSMVSLEGMADRTVTVSSLSKSHAMTGWRAGWLVGPEPLVEHAGRLSLAMHYGIAPFIQQAATVALTEERQLSEQFHALLHTRRDLLLEELKDTPKLRVLKPASGMVMLVDVSETGLTPNQFMHALYEQTGVSVLDGAAFGPSSADFIRLSFSIAEADIREGARRIKSWLANRP